MKYYISKEKKIRAFEGDGSQDHLITDDLVEIPEDQVQAVILSRQTIVELFDSKQAEVSRKFKSAMATTISTYTSEEIASFPTQESEAKAWDADNNSATPLLDYMLANRPTVDKPMLVSRILQNSVIYKQIAGPAIGKKQHYEDLLYALKLQHEDPEQPDVTQTDIDAIVVDFSTS